MDIPDCSKLVLIRGLPGSGKTTLAKPLANLLGAIHINADEVRKHYNDWDFTPEGRIRQAQRMKHLSDGAVLAGKVVVTDFVCPTEETRQSFDADFTVWMDTIKEGRFEDTNKMFQKPLKVDYHVQEWFNDTHAKLMEVVSVWMQRNG